MPDDYDDDDDVDANGIWALISCEQKWVSLAITLTWLSATVIERNFTSN